MRYDGRALLPGFVRIGQPYGSPCACQPTTPVQAHYKTVFSAGTLVHPTVSSAHVFAPCALRQAWRGYG
jgi:hypothetical protein